jgi:hypothetical protein
MDAVPANAQQDKPNDMSAREAEPESAQPLALEVENERLRAHVAALEAELVEVQSRANAAVAEWQERAYWLDRWHLDLNALMRRRGAAELRAALRAVRSVGRAFKRLRRRLRSP